MSKEGFQPVENTHFSSEGKTSHLYEPFIDESIERITIGRNRFKNTYGGPYATRLELNRTAAEKFVQLADFGGDITLANDSYTRTRDYIEINSDASVTAKKGLTVDQQNRDKQSNPYYRILPTGNGWTILINGQKIIQDISDHPHRKISDEERFVNGFNRFLVDALKRCAVGEKLTGIKDQFYGSKLFSTLIQPVVMGALSISDHINDPQNIIPSFLVRLVTSVPIAYAIVNWINRKWNPFLDEMDHREGLESLLPPLEVEKVLISKVYLNRNGSELVRLRSRTQ